MKPDQHQLLFLQNGGEVGEIMRTKDWATSALGLPQTWSQTLKNTLALLLNSHFPMLFYWGADYYCFYNDAFRKSLGNDGKHPSILGMKGSEAWLESWSTLQPMLLGVFTTGQATWDENRMLPLYRNGQLENAYWTFSYSPIKNENNEISGILTICTETTAYVNSLQKLEESEDELKFAIEATDLGTWDYNPISDKLKTNSRVKRWFGLPVTDEIKLDQATNAIVKEDRDRVAFAIQEALEWKSGGNYDAVYTIQNKQTGQKRAVRALGRAWFNEDKVAYRFNGTLQDITKQQKALNSLKISEERFRGLVKEIPVGIVIVGIEKYTIKVVNDMALFIWQKTREESEGIPLFEVLTEIEQGILPIFENVKRSKKPQKGMEYPFVLERNGEKETGYFNFVFKPILENGEVIEIMLVAFEVTDTVRAKFELQESEKQFKNFVMQSPIAMGILRGDALKVEMANDTLLDLFWRKDRREVIGKGLLDIFPNLSESKYPEVMRSIMATGKPVSEKESYAILTDKDGSWEFYVDYDYVPLREIDGKVSGVMVTTTDVTDRVRARFKLEEFSKDLERQVTERTKQLRLANDKLQRSIRSLENRNEELEAFAYVSSHDLQEPLRKIQMFTSRIIEREKDGLSDKGINYFEKITDAATRMRTLIDDLLAFSRSNKKDSEYEVVNLNHTLTDVLDNLSGSIDRTQAEIVLETLPTIEAIPFQMNQVFSNLVGNAIKFSKKNSRPIITITSAMALPKEVQDHQLIKDGTFYKITISDNGIGLPKNMEHKIFEVFQRVHGKHEYEGTGIGLAIVKKIIGNHGGAIFAESTEGAGTSFTMILPKNKF